MSDFGAIQFLLPSLPENGDRILLFLQDLATERNWHPELAERILQAGSEAFINGMEHGNGYNPSKTVEFTLLQQCGFIQITVQDQGSGFDPDALPDPLAEDRLLASGGRGVFLMRYWADEVRFEDEGRRVVLRFNMEP